MSKLLPICGIIEKSIGRRAKDGSSIRKSEKIYLSLWIIFLLGSIIVVESLSVCPVYPNILKTLEYISELALRFSIKK